MLVASTPLFGPVAYGLARYIENLSVRMQGALATATETASDTLVGVRTVRAFGTEDDCVARYARDVDAAKGHGVRRG